MSIREWFVANIRKIAIFLAVALVIAIAIVVSLQMARNARLIVMVAPTDADIKINGISYINGTYNVYPGKAKVEISKEGLAKKEYELDIKAHETTTIYAALANGEDYSWYSIHEEDYEILKLVADKASYKFIEKTENAKQIVAVLPLSKVTMLSNGKLANDDRPFYETVITNGSADKKCQHIFCLKVKDNTGNDDTIKELINNAGFNYEDYAIIYE